jgi:hypothetical protein
VTAKRFSPVCTRSRVTLAFGTTAPEGSLTVPRTSVDVVWAATKAAPRLNTSNNEALVRMFSFPPRDRTNVLWIRSILFPFREKMYSRKGKFCNSGWADVRYG